MFFLLPLVAAIVSSKQCLSRNFQDYADSCAIYTDLATCEAKLSSCQANLYNNVPFVVTCKDEYFGSMMAPHLASFENFIEEIKNNCGLQEEPTIGYILENHEGKIFPITDKRSLKIALLHNHNLREIVAKPKTLQPTPHPSFYTYTIDSRARGPDLTDRGLIQCGGINGKKQASLDETPKISSFYEQCRGDVLVFGCSVHDNDTAEFISPELSIKDVNLKELCFEWEYGFIKNDLMMGINMDPKPEGCSHDVNYDMHIERLNGQWGCNGVANHNKKGGRIFVYTNK